jgi:hypothetical protein
MAYRPQIPKFLTDGAVPDGAETMGDDWVDGGSSHSGVESPQPPPPDPPPGHQFVAFCWKCKEEGYYPENWSGEVRGTLREAQNDAEQHQAGFNHPADVRNV